MSGSPALQQTPLWRPEQYAGETTLSVTATQVASGKLAATGYAPSSAGRGILNEWITFFSAGPSPIRHLRLSSRVPQRLLDSLTAQTQLESLELKWGSYSDLSGLAAVRGLKRLELGGATKVTDLGPLGKLDRLESLLVDGAFHVTDFQPLSALTELRELSYGGIHPGSDKTVVVPDFDWVAPLTKLERLWMPTIQSTKLDLSPFANLGGLKALRLPLSRAYRDQVEALAVSNVAFADLASQYREHDEMSSRAR